MTIALGDDFDIELIAAVLFQLNVDASLVDVLFALLQCLGGEILELMEGPFAPVACLLDENYDCPRASKCETLPMWTEFYKLEKDFFYGKKLSDLIRK